MATLDDLTKIWKSSLPQNHKQKLFRATVETILLYGSTIWTLTKAPEASQYGTYTRIFLARNIVCIYVGYGALYTVSGIQYVVHSAWSTV